MDRFIIGLAGKAGAGKDTVADILLRDYGFRKLSFATALKQAASIMTGYPIEHFHAHDMKEKEMPEWGVTPRKFIQMLGTDLIRNQFRADFWVRRLEMELCDMRGTPVAGRFVITDCRFEDEAAWLREKGGTLIHIERPDLVQTAAIHSHASEFGVARSKGDQIIRNDSSLEDLRKVVHVSLTDMDIFP
jgi:hypothetical protein